MHGFSGHRSCCWRCVRAAQPRPLRWRAPRSRSSPHPAAPALPRARSSRSSPGPAMPAAWIGSSCGWTTRSTASTRQAPSRASTSSSAGAPTHRASTGSGCRRSMWMPRPASRRSSWSTCSIPPRLPPRRHRPRRIRRQRQARPAPRRQRRTLRQLPPRCWPSHSPPRRPRHPPCRQRRPNLWMPAK